ncbi:MAG: arginine--tRNA ligase, partial [Patescibacteria group bacterium]
PADVIRQAIERVVMHLLGPDEKMPGFVVEHPADEGHGDYASNVAMMMRGNSRELAQDLAEKLKKSDVLGEVVDLSRVEVAGPGFINFWLKREWLVGELKQVLEKKENYGTNDSGKGKLAIVEYSSPNIAKPFTIGHLRSTVIGDAIANLLEANGWRVLRDNHLGDWGTQFGKQICAIKHWGDIDKIAKSRFPVKELVALYVKFHEEAEKDPTLEDEAREWFKKLEDGDKEARELWQKCIDWSWVEFSKIYELLKIKHSAEFNQGKGLGESFFEDKMEVVIVELEKKKLLGTGKEDAKLVFFEKDKLPPMMIIKKDGASLYATRDLATDKYRLEKYKPDLVVNEVGAEQSLYFRQLFEIEKMLGWYKEGQRVHVGHGMFRFKEGKMSTRKGNVIWLEEVLSEAIKRAAALGNGEKNNVSQKVGIGALKWNDLKGDPKRDILFDWDEVLNMQGNSGPYIQYTFARAGSILAKSGKDGLMESVGEPSNEDERSVLRTLYRYPEVVVEAAKNFTPQVVTTYLFGLAQRFNGFYNLNQVVGGENEDFRLRLVAAVAQVLKNGLSLLGIEVVEKM